MSLPFSTLGNVTGSIFSASYFNAQDTTLFFVSQSKDIWFGYSSNDVIEFSVFDIQTGNQLGWNVLNKQKTFNTVNLTTSDNLNSFKNYTYKELVGSFTIYKNSKILLDVVNDLSSSGITSGSYNISYLFTRQLAGNSDNPLSIKEISPSRTEIKLIPTGTTDVSYTAFCLKKFPIKDIISIFISSIENCPYDNIYRKIQSSYTDPINFLKFIFFLPDDGSVLAFLKNLYEDFIKYTSLSASQLDRGMNPTKIIRIQGIKTYFNNFLLENYESISDFNELKSQFINFVNLRLDQKFAPFLGQRDSNYNNARQFVFDFFVKYFYNTIIDDLQSIYQSKYLSYFKNALNFGNNKFIPILSHDFIDERLSPNDPLTLLIKVSFPLPLDIPIKESCWISNIGMTPYVFTAIVINPSIYKTFKISPPNFGTPSNFISVENINKLYSSSDLMLDSGTQNDVSINKQLIQLNVDYNSFSNFVIFSSATARLNIFKNKIIQWTNLSSSMSDLENKYINSLSSSVIFPYFLSEKLDIQTQISDIIQSFDGYESYLFNSKNYSYSISSQSFLNLSYVQNNDLSASIYDSENRDSLINNTPQYIINDPNNNDYLTFLSMIGHHFDGIYTYISALPIERQVQNQLSSSLPVNTLKEILLSFGWNLNDIIESLNIDDVYLNNSDSTIYNSLSAKERLQTIWNRILIVLSGIYKTKGTDECIKYLLSCYGIPSSIISVREYGGIDFSDDSDPTYKLDEKFYMTKFSGPNDYIEGPFPTGINSIELKFSIENPGSYSNYTYNPLFSVIPYPYNSSSNAGWSIGFFKVPGQFLGRVIFQMGSGSSGAQLLSNITPIFNGDIFSIMLRRNNPYEDFEITLNIDSVPTKYDLILQRNDDGRKIFYSTSSIILNNIDNSILSKYGRFKLGNGDVGGIFNGTLDKLSLWNVALDDQDFNSHVDDINSYGYSGSNSYNNLIVRLSWDYPQSLYYNLSGSSSVWVDNRSSYYALPDYFMGNLSGSYDSQLYSASLNIINYRWAPIYPTGSAIIIAKNFVSVLDNNFSSSFNGCYFISSSTYPYNFREYTVQQNIDASKYGPNKYKNKKIKKIKYNVNSRLDSDDTSTSISDDTTSGASNQLGFFIDPQDSKNKDIIRYVGKGGIMEFISDPSDLYSDSYKNLKLKNVEYNSFGNKKILFNELLSVYKFYFDKSIFQSIKNIVPARANIFTGVVIEPTIIERPKYQHKQITSSVSSSNNFSSNISTIEKVSGDLMWANFNSKFVTSSMAPNYLSSSYQQIIDLRYINNPNRIFPNNLKHDYIYDLPDNIQNGTYADFETQLRLWDTNGNNPVYGCMSSQTPNDKVVVSGSIKLYYLLKLWEKNNYYNKMGEYSKTENPNDNSYSSASVYLYKYITVSEEYMKQIVYFYNNQISGVNDPSYTFFNGSYTHSINTFINTPDQKINNINAYNINNFNPSLFNIQFLDFPNYFQLVRGYPRNHYNNKLQQFSITKYPKYISSVSNSIFIKGRQTIDTTIGSDGVNDGSLPIQSFNVGNLMVVNSNNIILSSPTNTNLPGSMGM